MTEALGALEAELASLRAELSAQPPPRREAPPLRPLRSYDDEPDMLEPETPAQPLVNEVTRRPPRMPDGESITIAGTEIPTTDLDAMQLRLLRELARVPSLPTRKVRGTRYLVNGDRLYRDDCSNALRIPYDALGIDLFSKHAELPGANGVRLIREKGEDRVVTAPRVGDLVIFDDTWDKNDNGQRDDEDTHAAIVVAIDEDGTLSLYNRVRSGHRIHRMNLAHPGVYRDPESKKQLNDFLRKKDGSEDASAPRLTGGLFARFVRVLPEKEAQS